MNHVLTQPQYTLKAAFRMAAPPLQTFQTNTHYHALHRHMVLFNGVGFHLQNRSQIRLYPMRIVMGMNGIQAKYKWPVYTGNGTMSRNGIRKPSMVDTGLSMITAQAQNHPKILHMFSWFAMKAHHLLSTHAKQTPGRGIIISRQIRTRNQCLCRDG